MNYIHQLKSDLAAHIAAIESMRQSIHAFRSFLHSDKFTGMDTNGDRKDWISTGDVLAILRAMEDASVAAGETTKANWRPNVETTH